MSIAIVLGIVQLHKRITDISVCHYKEPTHAKLVDLSQIPLRQTRFSTPFCLTARQLLFEK